MKCARCGRAIPARRLENAARVGARAEYCSPSCKNAAKQARHRSRTPKTLQDRIHLRNLAAHGMIAAKVLADPSLLSVARTNVIRWMERNGTTKALEEWYAILRRDDVDEVVHTLLRVDEAGMQMRASSPFAGLLDDRELAMLQRAARN